MEFDYCLATQKGNVFESNVSIEHGAIIGKNNFFSRNCTIKSCCTIGDNNYFSTNVTIGSLPRERFQKPNTPKEITQTPKVVVGDCNVIEDNVVIQSSLEQVTRIGNDVCVGAFAHVSHDVTINDHVIIASHCSIGGYSILMEYANLGMGSNIHQRTVVGGLAMVGAGSVIIKHILPYSTVVGVPARYLRINYVGLKRAGYSDSEIELIDKWLTKGSSTILSDKLGDLIRTFKYAMGIWRRDRGIIPNIDISKY